MRYVFSDQKTYYSPVGVDKIIDEVYFPDQKTGNCIEVGAVDGMDGSNTLYFERLGWNCLCIEPQPGLGYFDSLKNNRKLALNYAISQKEQKDAKFTVVYCTPTWADGKEYPWSGMSGLVPDERLISDHEKLGLKPVKKEISVETKRLDWCIDNHFKHDTIDFISIDVEGSELDVLQSFNVNGYNTKLLIIENNFDDPDVENYLTPLGWKKDMRVEINDFYIKA